jgi:hypothetical protein
MTKFAWCPTLVGKEAPPGIWVTWAPNPFGTVKISADPHVFRKYVRTGSAQPSSNYNMIEVDILGDMSAYTDQYPTLSVDLYNFISHRPTTVFTVVPHDLAAVLERVAIERKGKMRDLDRFDIPGDDVLWIQRTIDYLEREHYAKQQTK